MADFSVDDFLGLPCFFLLYVFTPEKLYTPYKLPYKLLNFNPIRVKVFSSKPYTQPFTNPTRPVSANSLILRSGASLGVVRNLKKVLGIYRFLFRQFKGLGAIAQDFWTMGNEEEGATLVALDNALEDAALGGSIEGGGGFVEEQDGGWAQQGAGNADALGLSLTQSYAHLAQRGVDALGKFEDEIGSGRSEGFAHFQLGSGRVAQEEVVANRAAQEGIALGHIAEITAVSGCDGLELG